MILYYSIPFKSNIDWKKFLFLFLFVISLSLLNGQSNEQKISFLEPASTFHKGRFWTATAGGVLTYTSISIGLYNTWYKKYDRSSFHLFNDSGEWRNMDKLGHLLTTYHEARGIFLGASWTGMSHKKAAWTGFGAGIFLQSTLEFMDGFSTKWGFSLSDMGFNLLGSSLLLSQELLWQEQRISLKISASPKQYSSAPILSDNGQAVSSLRHRANNLFGTTAAELFLKDYNGHIIWASFNPSAFIRESPTWLPKWLNVAVGYGAEHLYGGFSNTWMEGDNQFTLSTTDFPRYRQYYLSLDIDFTRISTNSKFLSSLFHVLNFIKVPSPTLEWSQGKLHFHTLTW